ncbi:MAG: Ig-like domain-containing protein, partial [Firmicutes bacterium]|nr:Ig-like domain-containing protein [Bacillota bacterium]
MKKLKLFKLLVLCMSAFMFAYVLAGCGKETANGDKTVVDISAATLQMDLFDEQTITATASNDEPVTWASSDTATVSVNGGTLRALKAGGADITATSTDGESAVCKVTVVKGAVPIIQFDGMSTGSVELTVGGAAFTVQPKLMFKGAKQTDATFTFEEDDSEVFEVTAGGQVSALKQGQGVLTVKASWRGCTEPSMTEEVAVNVNMDAAVNFDKYIVAMQTSDIYGGVQEAVITATVVEQGVVVPTATVTWHEDAQGSDTQGAATILSTGDLTAKITMVSVGTTRFYAKTTLPGGVVESLRIPVTVAQTTLDTPADLTFNSDTKKVEWTDDPGAVSYSLKRDTDVFTGVSSPYNLANGIFAVSVKAVGNGGSVAAGIIGSIADSAWTNPITTMNLGDDQLLDIDKPVYEQAFRSTNTFGGTWWNALNFTATYVPGYEGADTGAVKLEYTPNSADGSWAFAFSFFRDSIEPAQDIVVRFKSDSFTGFVHIGYNGWSGDEEHANRVAPAYWSVTDDGATGWKLLTVKAAGVQGLDGGLQDFSLTGQGAT